MDPGSYSDSGVAMNVVHLVFFNAELVDDSASANEALKLLRD